MSVDENAPVARGFGRALALYTVLRMLVFVGTAGFFAIFGFNGLALLVIALLLSLVVSALVLRPQRAALVEAYAARTQRRAAERESLRARLDES